MEFCQTCPFSLRFKKSYSQKYCMQKSCLQNLAYKILPTKSCIQSLAYNCTTYKILANKSLVYKSSIQCSVGRVSKKCIFGAKTALDSIWECLI